MRRVLCHEQGLLNLKSAGRCLYFLLLILSIRPASVKDDGVEEHREKPTFVCNQSDYNEQSTPSVILESIVVTDSSTPKENQTLDTNLWALKFDKEVWHGDLVDDVQPAVSVLNVTLVTSDGQPEKQWGESNKTLKSSSAERVTTKDGKAMLVMHCNPRCFRSQSVQQNYSSYYKCLKISHQAQSSMITLGKDALPGKVMILSSPSIHHPMIFRLHDRCAWTDKTGSTHQGYRSSTILSFYDGKRSVHTLELGFNSSAFSSVEGKSFTERINWLLDEKRTKFACTQGTSKEFTVRNTGPSSLQVYSLMIKGENNLTHGFKVDFLSSFHLGQGQSAKLLISHQPDFKTVMTEAELQFVTSHGILSVILKANAPAHVQSFCQDAVLFAKARKFFLQVCTLALFLVLLVFGKMLKQEGLVMSDASPWPSSASNALKLSQRSHGEKSIQDQNDKSSSIYVSIDFGCNHDESGQFSNLLSLTKAFDAVISCIVRLKFLYISHVSNAQQPVTDIIRKQDTPHSKQNNNPASSNANSIAGKKRTCVHPRACNKTTSMTSSGGGSTHLRIKTHNLRKDKTILQQDVMRSSDKAESKLLNEALSDREKEKIKMKKRNKGLVSVMAGNGYGSDSGSSSSLSMPSSPVIRDVLCGPVNPLSPASITVQNHHLHANMDTTTTHLSADKDGSKTSHWHYSTSGRLPFEDEPSFQAADSEAQIADQTSLQSKSTTDSFRSLVRADQGPGTIWTKPSDVHQSKEAALRSVSKGSAITKAKGATLTVSATFPAPGRRSLLQESLYRVQDNGQKWPSVASSSSLDLVSTSAVAPHARAPGSPLSPKSPSSAVHPLSPSFFTTLSGSPLSTSSSSPLPGQPSSPVHTSGRRQGGTMDKELFWPQHKHAKLRYSGARKSNGYYPYHEQHYAEKRRDTCRASEAVVSYDIWGHRFVDLDKRWKDAPYTMKPSPLPPLLKTPAFSVFSSNDQFSG